MSTQSSGSRARHSSWCRTTRRWSPTRRRDRESTRLNSSHTDIYLLSLHDALPISFAKRLSEDVDAKLRLARATLELVQDDEAVVADSSTRSGEHTSELQPHRHLPSFPTRRSSDLVREAVKRGCRRKAPARARDTRAGAGRRGGVRRLVD